MARMIVVDRDGKEHEVEGKSGLKIMEILRELDYGVAAICGGLCSCATCHVYVDAAWLPVTGLPVPASQEASMLSFAAVTQADSRLSCQIPVTDALDGLVVRMPEGQH